MCPQGVLNFDWNVSEWQRQILQRINRGTNKVDLQTHILDESGPRNLTNVIEFQMQTFGSHPSVFSIN